MGNLKGMSVSSHSDSLLFCLKGDIELPRMSNLIVKGCYKRGKIRDMHD